MEGDATVFSQLCLNLGKYQDTESYTKCSSDCLPGD
jgi:hypothetical protein